MIETISKAIILTGSALAVVERERAFANKTRDYSMWSILFAVIWFLLTFIATQ